MGSKTFVSSGFSCAKAAAVLTVRTRRLGGDVLIKCTVRDPFRNYRPRSKYTASWAETSWLFIIALPILRSVSLIGGVSFRSSVITVVMALLTP